MSFEDELILTIVDKLAIGILIVFAGLVANVVLEKYKSKRAFYTEIAKIRTNKIGEVWSLLYEHEAIMNTMISLASRYRLVLAGSMELRKGEAREDILRDAYNEKEKAMEKGQQIADLLEHSRFWLGEDFYNKCLGYDQKLDSLVNIFTECLMASVTQDEDKTSKLRNEFDKLKQEVESMKVDIAKTLEILK